MNINLPNDPESIRIALEQAAAAAFRRAQSQMENLNMQDSQRIRSLLESAASEAIARAQEFDLPREAFHRQAQAVEGAFVGLWPIVKQALVIYTTSMTILTSSLVTYGLFYLAIQPGKAALEPLFFDYSGIAQHPVCSNLVNHTELGSCQSGSKSLQEDGDTALPWAAADFFSKETQWEAYHVEVLPKARTEKRILRSGQAYYFEIALDLPESEVNRRTGMFMVHVDLQSSNGTKLASSVRATRIPHETDWVSTVRKSLWLVPLLIGAAQETRRIVVPSFRHYVESSNFPLRYATVRLVMQDKDRDRKEDPLEVLKGDIRIGKELNEFQFLLREWFFTCYIVGTLILCLCQAAALLGFRQIWRLRLRDQILRQMQEDDLSDQLELDESQLSQEPNEWEDLSQQENQDNVVTSEDGASQVEPISVTETSQQEQRSEGFAPSLVVEVESSRPGDDGPNST